MTEGPARDGQKERRSERIALRIPVHVEYSVSDGRLSSDSVTIKVNDHGALLRWPWGGVPAGRELLLENPASRRTQTATVVFIKYVGDHEFDVGVEFTQPNPQFWSVSFPHED